MGALLSIAVRDASRVPMKSLDEAAVTRAAGVAGDFRGTVPGRQVTVVVREAWEAACAELDTELPWTTRRANLLVEGMDLAGTTGSKLVIGDVVLEITGETDPCGRMEEALPGLKEALTPEWRAGVMCTVEKEGTIRVGDSVRIESSVVAQSGAN